MSPPANPTLPPGMDDAAFALLSKQDQLTWLQWVQNVRWCAEQPQFRAVMTRFIDDPQFCGATGDPFDTDPLVMARKTGLAAAGRLLMLQVQHIAPRMWRKALNEESARREAAEVPQ